MGLRVLMCADRLSGPLDVLSDLVERQDWLGILSHIHEQELAFEDAALLEAT